MKRIIASIMTVLLISVSAFTVYAAPATVKNHSYKEGSGKHTIHLDYPVFSGFQSAPQLNKSIESLLQVNRTEIKKSEEEAQKKDGVDFTTSLTSLYDYSLTGDILSVWMDVNAYTGGAHGANTRYAFTVNTKTNENYKMLSQLFQEDIGYEKILTENIIQKVNKAPDTYFDNAVETMKNLNGKFDFFIDGNELVIYFNQYDIAPYSSGKPTFRFTAEELKPILKDEVYQSIKDGKPLGAIRINGTDASLSPEYYVEKYQPMLPLRAICNLFGYQISWDATNGAFVNEISVDKTTTSVTKDGVIYVPITFFTETLNESIYYNDMQDSESTYNNLLRIFTPEITGAKFDTLS